MTCWVVIILLHLLINLTIPIGPLISAKSQPSPIHIFLSFRGTDTRETFASLLHDALSREGFNVFMDDQCIRSGQDIDLVIADAIDKSLGAVIIFSEDFASSEWCLDELVLILGRKKKLGSKYVLQPIYVDGVQPYEVRNQRGSYGKALAKLNNYWCPIWDSNKLKIWRHALTQVVGYKGRILKGKWSKFINKLVEEIKQEFDMLGITVSPQYCPYHSTKMDRVHAIHEYLKKLAVIGNLIFLMNTFLSSALIKYLCSQFMQLMATFNWQFAVLLTLIIFLAIKICKWDKKALPEKFLPEKMADEILPEIRSPETNVLGLTVLIMASTIKATVMKSLAASMKKLVVRSYLHRSVRSVSTALYNNMDEPVDSISI